MGHVGRTACVAGAALVLVCVAAALAYGAGEPAPEGAALGAVLREAAQAHARGDAATARAKLREAAQAIDREGFHHRLAAAGTAYDRGEWSEARARLKSATWLVEPYFWFGLGFVAQLLFSARFIVQWIASERKGKSYFPMAFWYFSLAGSALLLTYSIWRQDPVFILGQSFNSVIYVRNLMLIFRQRAAEAKEAAA